ncbi:MAG: LytR/AlgR family response regulator transcription factor [Saprospiraceae bacterium]
MKNIRALIVDDEAPARRIMRKLLERYCTDVFVVAEAADIATARQAITVYHPDLILLDVDLRGSTGFKLMEYVNATTTHVVFVTAHADFALRAFKVAATDYLVKPVDIDRLRESIARVRNRMPQDVEGGKGKLLVPQSQGKRVLSHEEIIRIEADGSYSTIYLSSGEQLLVVRKIGQLNEELLESSLLRIHRSHMINLEHITKVNSAKIEMKDGAEVPVSRNRTHELMERLKS